MRPPIQIACVLAVVASCLGWSQPGRAWGPTGHQIVGQIADASLNANAQKQVTEILGYSLGTAAPWLDCVKSVSASFKYSINPMYQKPCDAFMPGAENSTVNDLPEVQRMDDYVKRNWSNCVGRPGKGCHEDYHFADVDPVNTRYGDFYGTNEHDVVHAINAALLVLQDKPAPAPFSIKDKKEALFLLAHLVGDLHQPLHVGAIYLSPAGEEVHPDQPGMSEEQKKASETAGGNSLTLDGKNLHSIWDQVPGTWPSAVRAAVVAKGGAIAKTPGRLEELAALWASDTVAESEKAFARLKFDPQSGKNWPATATVESYNKFVSDLAQTQIEKAGARLAQLLNAVWP